MLYTEMTKKAMLIAYDAHRDKFDKGGAPYIFHPFHLAEQMDSEESVIVALLHDVVEDSDWTIEDMEREGFSNNIIDALKLLTNNDKIEYLEYIKQIKMSTNQYAKKIKLADLKHNSDLSRLMNVDEKSLARVEKYAKAISILEG